jgi:predicted DNA-binding protein
VNWSGYLREIVEAKIGVEDGSGSMRRLDKVWEGSSEISMREIVRCMIEGKDKI